MVQSFLIQPHKIKQVILKFHHLDLEDLLLRHITDFNPLSNGQKNISSLYVNKVEIKNTHNVKVYISKLLFYCKNCKQALCMEICSSKTHLDLTSKSLGVTFYI